MLDEYDVTNAKVDESLLPRIAHVYRIRSFDSVESVAAIAADLLVRGVHIEQIVSWTEYSQYGAGVLAGILAPSNFSLPMAVAVRDKRWMKHLVRQAGIQTAAAFSIPDAADQVTRDALVKELRFPMVVKPVSGLGTSTTYKVEDERGLNACLDDIKNHYQAEFLQTRQLVAEEFIEGVEFHVDALWGADQEPLFFCISQYYAPLLATMGHRAVVGAVVVREDEEPALYRDVREMNRRANAALGIRPGLTHMEVFREEGSGKLYFSEIANRMGGANISETMGCWAGWDLLQMWGHLLIDGPALRMPAFQPRFRHVGWINLLPTRSGKVSRVPSPEEIEAVPGVLMHEVVRGVGTELDLEHGSVWTLLLVIGADTPEAYRALMARVTEELRIEVE